MWYVLCQFIRKLQLNMGQNIIVTDRSLNFRVSNIRTGEWRKLRNEELLNLYFSPFKLFKIKLYEFYNKIIDRIKKTTAYRK
jgi:hypothetical protein